MNTMTLPVKLTETELLVRGHELADNVRDLEDVELRKKTAMTGFKDEIESLEAQISKLGRVVREGKEDREVEVMDQRDEERMLMNTIRLDTCEVVSYRDLKGHERNLKLFPSEVETA